MRPAVGLISSLLDEPLIAELVKIEVPVVNLPSMFRFECTLNVWTGWRVECRNRSQ